MNVFVALLEAELAGLQFIGDQGQAPSITLISSSAITPIRFRGRGMGPGLGDVERRE